MKSKKLVALVLVDHYATKVRGILLQRASLAIYLPTFLALSLLLLAELSLAQVNSVDVSPDFPFGAPNTNMDGRIPGIVLDPTNNSILYADGEWTGVWKSVDGAHTWQQSSTGLRNGITQENAYPNLAIDATNSQRLLYATTSKDGRGFICTGCRFGGLWVSVNGAASWQHVNLCSVNPPPNNVDNVASVVFSSGRPFVATDCGIWTTTDASLQTGWSPLLTLPTGVSPGGTIFAPSSYGQTLFACLGDGTRVYRSLNLGQTWDAGVDVGGRCTGLAVAPLAGEFQPSTSVVIHSTSAPVNSGPGNPPGSNALEVTLVNHNSTQPQNLGFAQKAVNGSGRSGVWAVRRTAPLGGATGPAVSYDVLAADNLQFYRYTGSNQWSGAFPVHGDSWWMEFPNTYDSSKAGNCPAYAANDGGVVENATNSCLFNGWVGASSGLHVAWGNHISGLSSTNLGNSAKLCAASQGGQPCPLLYLPTTDDDVFIREPNGSATYSWTNLPDCLGDAGVVLVDPAQPNLALACRNGTYNMFVAPSGQLPTPSTVPFPTLGNLCSGQPPPTDFMQGIQPPSLEAIKQVLTMPNESPLTNGDFLALRSRFSTNFNQCQTTGNCGNDIIVRNVSAALQNAAESSWFDISPNAQFGPGQVTGIYPSGGHNTTVYVLTSNFPGVSYVAPRQAGQVYKAQSQLTGEAITSWQLASGSGVNSLTTAYNLFVNPYDPTELWAIDLGSSPSAIKVSRDGGQSWTAVQQLKDIATNYGEFDFTCGARPFANYAPPNGSSGYNDKEIFGNECSMTQMLFPPGLPQLRFAILYPGGVAFSGDGGNSWIPLNATNSQPSQQPIELPQSAFYDPSVNAAGNSSLYVALEGKGVKRIDAPFATLASMPQCGIMTGCVSTTNWSYSMTCTGVDVGIVYNAGCTDLSGERRNCYAGFNGQSTVQVSWSGSSGPPNWWTAAQQGSPTACTTNNTGQSNCKVFTFAGLPPCPTPPPGPPPLCQDGQKYCTKFTPPRCVPEKQCLVNPIHP